MTKRGKSRTYICIADVDNVKLAAILSAGTSRLRCDCVDVKLNSLTLALFTINVSLTFHFIQDRFEHSSLLLRNVSNILQMRDNSFSSHCDARMIEQQNEKYMRAHTHALV